MKESMPAMGAARQLACLLGAALNLKDLVWLLRSNDKTSCEERKSCNLLRLNRHWQIELRVNEPDVNSLTATTSDQHRFLAGGAAHSRLEKEAA